ncbi:ferredoxin-type protein NapF [Bradyrhizobium sp. AZCC 2262]|uniref:4Fe-4S dicluster domain-containing protein n=1 Tax=Bradyrhizobium sp. AZCC 2262 TaxID=3117022 RepID=UPI002FF211B0
MESPGPSRRALLRGQLLARPIAVINEDCLAEAGIVCRSCGDACPDAAIRFRPRIGLPPEAVVSEAACTGCGHCVGACPGDAITLGAARRGDAS